MPAASASTTGFFDRHPIRGIHRQDIREGHGSRRPESTRGIAPPDFRSQTCVGALTRPLPSGTTTAHSKRLDGIGRSQPSRTAGVPTPTVRGRFYRGGGCALGTVAAISDHVIRDDRITRGGACQGRTMLKRAADRRGGGRERTGSAQFRRPTRLAATRCRSAAPRTRAGHDPRPVSLAVWFRRKSNSTA